MSNFTIEEKEAINRLLVRLIKADGHTKISEAVILYEISESLGIKFNEVEESLCMSFEEAKNIVCKMSEPKKNRVYNMLNSMAMSDGRCKSEERELIISIFSKKKFKV